MSILCIVGANVSDRDQISVCTGRWDMRGEDCGTEMVGYLVHVTSGSVLVKIMKLVCNVVRIVHTIKM